MCGCEVLLSGGSCIEFRSRCGILCGRLPPVVLQALWADECQCGRMALSKPRAVSHVL